MIKLIKTGTSTTIIEEGLSCLRVTTFHRWYRAPDPNDPKKGDISVEPDDNIIRGEFDYPDGETCQHEGDCCGRYYGDSIEILRGITTIVVLQHFNMNI